MEAAGQLRIIDPLNAEWVTLLLVAVVAALAWINMSAPRKWRLMVQAMFRMRLGRQALREEFDLQDRTFLGSLGVSVAVIALFLWQVVIVLAGAEPPAFLVLLTGVSAVMLAQVLLVGLLAWIFQGDGGLREYLATGMLLFVLLGMILLPMAMLTAYRSDWRPGLVLAGLVLVALLLLYRWTRGLWIGAGEGVPARYIILYLCAAEVAPLLLLLHGLGITHLQP